MYNQTNSSNSEFKMPQAPQPQRVQSESLLFNDILEEINTAIRNQLSEFLQVQPYRLFNMELTNFFKRIDHLKQEGQQNGTNISRLANSSQKIVSNSRPSSNSNFSAPSTRLMANCNRNSTIRQSKSNVQPIAINPFKPPIHNCIKSNEVVLPRANQSNYVSQGSSNMYNTIVEVSHNNNNTAKTNNKHNNPPETVFKCPSDTKDAYSNIKFVVENKSASASHQNENKKNSSYSINSLLEAIGLPDNNNTTNSNNNENNCKLLEKYLSKWSININITKSKKPCVLLTGTLLEANRLTIAEEKHKAGFIICRKEKDLLKTNNGLYRLIGKIISGSPDELYQECLSKNGFPVKWKICLNKYSWIDTSTKKSLLNCSSDSPTSSITSMKPIKKSVNLDMSMTRAGKIYSHNIVPLRKRIKHDDDVSGKSKTNYAAFNGKLPLLASTPKRPKKLPVLHETPTQILMKQ